MVFHLANSVQYPVYMALCITREEACNIYLLVRNGCHDNSGNPGTDGPFHESKEGQLGGKKNLCAE